MNNEVIICACGSAEHQWLIRKVDGDNECIYIHAHLFKYGFWRRVKYAIRYVLGKKSRYGAWDEIILTSEHAGQFQRLADELKALKP